MTPPNRRALFHVVAMGRPFFVSKMRWRAAGALALVMGLLLALNGLNVVNSYVGRTFITALSKRDRQQYVVFALLYLGVFAASTVAGTLHQYVQDRLALSWRDWLTQHLVERYIAGQTFARIRANPEIDNPDQRIAEDVKLFTSTLLSFIVMVANSVLTTVAFAGVLWAITPKLFLAAVLYSALGSLLTVVFGYRLVGLNNAQLRIEADLRCSLIRAREEVDLSSAEGRSWSDQAHDRLRSVVENCRAIIVVNRNVGFFTSGYHYLIPLVPVLIVAPSYLRGEVELGVITQSAMAFAQLLGGFSLIVAQFQSISTFAAVIDRLGSLWEEIEAVAPTGTRGTPSFDPGVRGEPAAD
jgi:vitamin B12/bleomycin/antimicrobial peptide transport system ATP-binding/permease protein